MSNGKKLILSTNKLSVIIQSHLLGEVSHFINPEAASWRDGAVEEAWVQQWPVHVPAGLVLSLASQTRPEVILLLALSQRLKK